MKILILSNNDLGLYKFRFELLEVLVKRCKVFVCTPDGEFTQKFTEIGCKYIPCDMLDRRSTNPVKDLKLLSFYKAIIKKIKPNVVLTYTIKPNVYGGLACSKAHVPVIANVTGLGTTIENGGLLSKISMSLYKAGLKNAACVFFQNRNNRDTFVDAKVVKGKTRVIPGSGVNLQTHNFESYPSDDNGVRFLFVGRIMKDKGIEELLEAIRKLHNANKKIVLDIVGDSDEDYSTLLKQAEDEGAIILHGVQSDVHPFYKACHCTVLPSYHEGTPNVILEASSTGRPVITTNVPGCRETFDEGITGFGCEAKSAESLFAAMKKFLELPQEKRAEMGINARKKMEKEYDRNIVIKAYMEEIREAIKENV